MILLIDNHDSFTFNLVHFLGDLGAGCERHRNLPVFGVQFHSESIASEHAHALLSNFLKISREHTATDSLAA